MIIVEGPDGAGKTLLVQKLSEDLGVMIEPKVVQPDMTSEVDLTLWCKSQMRGWPQKKIYDRFPLISEFIYGPIFKHSVRAPFMDFHTLRALHDNFRTYNPLVIYCLPPLSRVMANVRRSDTDNAAVNGPQMEGVYWAYHNMAARDYCLVWDYTKLETYDDMIQRLKTMSYRRNRLEY